MILTCPSCDTRYSVDGSKFPAAGRTVRCAKCGHSWHQPGDAPEPAPEQPAALSEPVSEAPAPESFAPIRDSARVSIVVEPERAPPGPRIAMVAGWAGLIVVVLLIAYAAVHYRQDIATIWPQSTGVYSSLGLPVNASGIEIGRASCRERVFVGV